MKKTAISELNDIFEANKSAIADIYVKHGFGNIPVSPLTAGVCYKAKPAIADDLAEYLVPDQYNNAAGPDDKKANRQALAGGILGFLGNAMTTFSSIVGAKNAAGQVQQTGYIPGVTPPPNNPPANNPAAEEAKKKIFGLTYMQAGLIAGVLLLILFLVLGNKGGKKVAAPASA